MRDKFDPLYNIELVRKILQDDGSAMEELVRVYSGLVYSIALTRLNYDADRAEELCQDVFLRVYFNLPRLTDAARLPAWIAQITRNLAADWIRKDLRKSAFVQIVDWEIPTMDSIRDEGVGPREAAAANEEKDHINAALQKLIPQDQEIILMHFAEGLTLSQIARSIGKSVSTAKRQLDEAVSRVRKVYLSDPGEALSNSKRKPEQTARLASLMAGVLTLSLSQKNALAAVAMEQESIRLSAISPGLGWGKIAALVGVAVSTIGVGYFLSKLVPTGKETIASEIVAMTGGSLGSSSNKTDIRILSEPASRNLNLQALPNADSARISENKSLPECPTLKRCLEALRISDQQLSHCQYTYNTSYTVVGRNPILDETDLRVDERIGTVTLLGESYLVESRKVSDKPVQNEVVTILARDGRKNFPVLLNKNSVGESATLIKNDSLASLRHYAPMLKMQSAIYGDGMLDDFLESQISKNAELKVQCQLGPGEKSVVQVSGLDWTIELNRDRNLLPVRIFDRSSTTGPLKSIRECSEISQVNGVPYPSRFNTKMFGRDINGHNMTLQETTVSITMQTLGTTSPIPEEIFEHLYSKVAPETTSTFQTDKQIERQAAHRAGIEELLKRRQ